MRNMTWKRRQTAEVSLAMFNRQSSIWNDFGRPFAQGVSAIDPVVSTQAIDNDALTVAAGQVRDLLAKDIEAI